MRTVALILPALAALAFVPAAAADPDPVLRIEFQARPADGAGTVRAASVERAVAIMRDRAARLAPKGATIRRSGADRIVARLPGVRDSVGAVRRLGAPGRLYVFDWEANVLDAGCRAHPERVDGGQQPVKGFYDAVLRASQCPPRPARPGAAGERFYVFDSATRRPIDGGVPYGSRAALEADLEARDLPFQPTVLTVPPGVLVLRAEDENPADYQRGDVDRWWVVNDDATLDGTDVERAAAGFEGSRGGRPTVQLDFTRAGRKAIRRLTRTIVRRAAANAGQNGGDPVAASHHFAIRLDDDVLLRPYVDFRKHPDGFGGSRGLQIAGGFGVRRTKDLAALIASRPLPLRMRTVSVRMR